MAKMTKAKRSAAGRKAAKTRKANKAKKSAAARKGARKRTGKRSGGATTRSPAQRRATARMLAANKRSGRSGGRRRKGASGTGRRSSLKGEGGAIGKRVTNLEHFARGQMKFNEVVFPAVRHVYQETGMRLPAGIGPRSLGSGR